jgi:colicin import membrane protein
MWRFIRENPKAFIFAVFVHVAFVLALIFSLDGKTPTPAVSSDVKIVKARVIDEAKIKKERQRKEAIKRKKEQQKKAAEQKKREARKRAAKRKAEQKRKREQEKQRLVLKKKKEAEARKKKLAAEKKRKAEELRKKREEQERQTRIAELQKQMEQEEAERNKQAQRVAQQKEVDRFRALIKQAISNKWRIPVSARKGQECILKLRLIPSGEVVSVEVIKSSGDTIYDRSVEAAVFRASPLPLPPAESGLFNEFREINVPFRLESRN